MMARDKKEKRGNISTGDIAIHAVVYIQQQIFSNFESMKNTYFQWIRSCLLAVILLRIVYCEMQMC